MTKSAELDLAIENVERFLDKRLIDAALIGLAWIEANFPSDAPHGPTVDQAEGLRTVRRRLKLRTK